MKATVTWPGSGSKLMEELQAWGPAEDKVEGKLSRARRGNPILRFLLPPEAPGGPHEKLEINSMFDKPLKHSIECKRQKK